MFNLVIDQPEILCCNNATRTALSQTRYVRWGGQAYFYYTYSSHPSHFTQVNFECGLSEFRSLFRPERHISNHYLLLILLYLNPRRRIYAKSYVGMWHNVAWFSTLVFFPTLIFSPLVRVSLRRSVSCLLEVFLLFSTWHLQEDSITPCGHCISD